MNYENYRKRREFEDSLKMLKESCMFEQEESTEGSLPLDVTGGNEDVDKASNSDVTSFMEDETEENQYIKDIRKLAFKGMVAEEEAGRVHSEVYERLKKLFLELDKRNDSKTLSK